MNRTHLLRGMTLPVLAAASLAACGESAGPDGTARLTVLLTDAPGDVAQAVVTIDRVELVGGPERIVLRDTPWTGDVTQLSNDFAVLVEDAVVPQGSYSQLRLLIPEGCIGVETSSDPAVYVSDGASVACDGTPAGSLQMPSFAQTGIKVNFQGPISVDSDQKIVMLDFDVAESFGKLAGGSGQWVMHPVILGADFSFTGTVNVTLELADGVTLPSGVTFEDFTANLDGENQAFASDGTASFLFVVPGNLSLDVTPPSGTTIATTPSLPTDLTLGSQETLDVTITIDSIT